MGKQDDRAGAHVRLTRVVAWTVVVAVHAALCLYVSLPVPPWRPVHRGGRDVARPGMRVRLIERSAADTAAVSARAVVMPPVRAMFRPPSVPRSAPAPRSVGLPHQSRPLDLTLHDDGTVFGGRAAGRVEGGRQAAVAPAKSLTRLPGGASRFHMRDPRDSGVGGVVRFIGGLFGAVDPRCVDVDAWRAMTPAERRDKGIYDDKVERVAERHGCTPPKRESLQGGPRNGPLCPPWRCPVH